MNKENPPIEHIRLVIECFCDLYTEGITINELEEKTNLKQKDIIDVLTAYKGLFFYKKINNNINFIYLRRARSLKCAYTIFKYSNMSKLNFQWNETDVKFIEEMSNPKYINRTFKSLLNNLNWNAQELLETIEKWQDKGVICKKGKKVVFTYLGWPLWAAIIINKIWIQQNEK